MRTVARVFQALAVFVIALPFATGQTPFLGVLVEEVFAEPGADAGVTVLSVDPDGAAWRAGVEDGDRIVGLGDQAVADRQDLADGLQAHSVGERVPLVLVRDGERWHTRVLLAARPQTAAESDELVLAEEPEAEPSTGTQEEQPVLASRQEQPHGWLGIEVEEVPGGPLVIVQVQAGSPADRAGLKVEDELNKADQVRLETLDTLSEVLDPLVPGSVVTLEFERQGDRMRTKARLALPPEWSEAVPAMAAEPAPQAPKPPPPAPKTVPRPEPDPVKDPPPPVDQAVAVDQRVAQLETLVVDLQRELETRSAQLEQLMQQRDSLQARLDRQGKVLQEILEALKRLDRELPPGSPLQE